jgi:hypothetical protein
MSAEERNQAVDEMIALVGAVDAIVRAQAAADVEYFLKARGTALFEENLNRLHRQVLRAYRWQYILSGVEERRFQKVLRTMVTEDQLQRIQGALAHIAAMEGAQEVTLPLDAPSPKWRPAQLLRSGHSR